MTAESQTFDALAVVGPDLELAAAPTRRGWVAKVFLRWGVSPYFLLSDLVALAVAAALIGRFDLYLTAMGACSVWFFAAGGLYRSRLRLSVLDQAPDLAVRVLAAAAATTVVALMAGVNAGFARPLFEEAVGFAGCAIVMRGAAFATVRAARRHGLVEHGAIILGAGRVGCDIATTLRERREYGLRPIGFLDSDPLLGADARPAPVLGGVDALADAVLDTGACAVIIAFSSLPSSRMVDIIRTCDRLQCELFVVPRLFELHDRSGDDVEFVWGMPLLRMREAPFRRFSWRIKRLVDVLVAGFLLLLLSPVLGFCALGTRVETGRVLFRQRRVGIDGRGFWVLKFCSMRPEDPNESAERWSIADDDRVGPFGRFLRRTSLDELPQLWNVLRGDMSLVGPRPERPYFVDQFAATYPRYMARHRVPCGITGWAQVHGLRGDTSISDRARFDNYYIENWSLWFDLKIIGRTLLVILGGQGA